MKSVSWIKTDESGQLDQFDQFTLKIAGNGYPAKYGFTQAQIIAIRNDYLWLRYACTCTRQFEQELRNRIAWRNHLKNGPETATAADVPAIGSEFLAPNVPPVADGVLMRWRAMVAQIKNHRNYDQADGHDLDIEGTETPAQSTKPTAKLRSENGHVVRINVFKDGHEAVIVWCRRGNETQATKLGVFTRASITDDRPNLSPGQPECREYTFQYVDGDEPVGEVSDVFRIVTTGIQAA
jgi:hypothetical protein